MFGTATIGLILEEKLIFLSGIGLTILFIVIGFWKKQQL